MLLCIFFSKCFYFFPFCWTFLSSILLSVFWASQVLICHFPKAPLAFPCPSAFQDNSPGSRVVLPEAVPIAPAQFCWYGKLLCILYVLPGLCWVEVASPQGAFPRPRFKFAGWISLQIRPFNASSLTHEFLDERNVYLAFIFFLFWLYSLWSGKSCSVESFGSVEKSVTRRSMN